MIAEKLPLFDTLNNKIAKIADYVIENDNTIKDSIVNRNLGFHYKEQTFINFVPLKLLEDPNIPSKSVNCRYTSRKLIKEISNNLLNDKIENPYNPSDYRYEIFKNPSVEEKEWFINIVKDNYKFDSMLYASDYPIGHPKWEDRENKACRNMVSKKSMSISAIALYSPFIRLNSKNIFNNFVVDIDFPELKGNKEALLEKYNLLIEYFKIIEKETPQYVPNFVTMTSKGFQLGYVFSDSIFHKYKKDILAAVAHKEVTGKFQIPVFAEYIKRESAYKLEKFYNDTMGLMARALTILFNGDKNAIQTYTQGRVIRNPLVNASMFLTLEKKSIKACQNSFDKFFKLHSKIIKDINPFGVVEAPKKEDVEKVKKHKIASTTLSKEELKLHPYTITANKKEFIENHYQFKDELEETLVKDLFITYKLPAIDFSKTKGEGFRNIFLFTYGRFFAYELKKINPEVTDEELYNKLSIVLDFINRNFERKVSLGEIDDIIANITKFVQNKFNPNINVKFNRKLAQLKSYKTKIRFGKDLLTNPLLTIKHLKEMTIKDIAKLTSVAYKTLLRWTKEDTEALIKIFKEVFKMMNVKKEDDVEKININNLVSEFKLRTIVNNNKTIDVFYKTMAQWTPLWVLLGCMKDCEFHRFIQTTMLQL